MITDGKQTTTSQYTKLSEASRGIKNKGVIVYAIGVGGGVDQAELEEIASGLDYIFTSSSFESLQNEASKIRKSVCEVSKPGKWMALSQTYTGYFPLIGFPFIKVTVSAHVHSKYFFYFSNTATWC